MRNLLLTTTRLDLFPLSLAQLTWFLDDEKTFIRKVGPASRVILTDLLQKAIRLKIEKMVVLDSGDLTWITYWLMRLQADKSGIGMLGFKGLPDQGGQVEIGYGIDPAYQNQGYTTEAVSRLIQWAFEDDRCQRIIAPGTRKDNPASNRVLEKVGMKIYQETTGTYSWALDRTDYSKNPQQGNCTL